MKLEKIIAISLCAGSILYYSNSYPDETKTLEQVEQELKENEKKIEENERLIIAYENLKKTIQYYANEKKTTEIPNLLKNFDLEINKSQLKITQEIKNDYPNINYFELRYVEAKTERIITKTGYYEQVWIKPVYKEEKPPIVLRILQVPMLAADNIINPILKDEPLKPLESRQVKISDGYYKNGTWHDNEYKIINTPAYYQRYQVFPYTNKEILIEDNIPIEKVEKK